MQVAANVNESLLPSIGASVPELFPPTPFSLISHYNGNYCDVAAEARNPARIFVSRRASLCGRDSRRRRVCTE